MGSHGGATAEGQCEMLADLGVDESTVGCEIRSSMEVTEIGRTTERAIPVVADVNAVAADAIVPINRIKPHTDFDGTVESASRQCSLSVWASNAVRRSLTTGHSTGRFEI